MDEDANKIVWVVIIVAAVAVIGGIIINELFPNFMDQIQDYIGTVFNNFDTNTGSGFIVGALQGAGL